MIFTKSYSMGNKYQVYQALNHFIYGVGIPSERMTDDTKELYIYPNGREGYHIMISHTSR